MQSSALLSTLTSMVSISLHTVANCDQQSKQSTKNGSCYNCVVVRHGLWLVGLVCLIDLRHTAYMLNTVIKQDKTMQVAGQRKSCFAAGLVVHWCATDAEGRCVHYHHLPVQINFVDVDSLCVELQIFARMQEWDRVEVIREDLSFFCVLYTKNANLDFQALANSFLQKLRTAGRSRFSIALHLLPAG